MQIKIKTEELRKASIFLATPMYGGMCAGMFCRSVADLTAMCVHYQIPLKMYYMFNESLITRARNYCVDEFLRSDCTHLMFIDSDIAFNPNDVIGLLALNLLEPDKYNVITAPYPKKCISWEKIKQAVDKGVADEDPQVLEKFVGDYVFNPKPGTTTISLGEPAEVLEAGTGFMMIPRATLLKYKENYPTFSLRPDHVRTDNFDGSREILAYFDCVIDRGYTFEDIHRLIEGVSSGTIDAETAKTMAGRMLESESKASKRYLSEDYFFCQNVIRMGGRIWLCPWMQLQHVGSYVFGGSLIDLASIGAAATADMGKLKKNSTERKFDALPKAKKGVKI